ncbi:MAG: alpha/beta fold hydrolase [Acidimicrobiales bacterium]
MRSAVNFWFRKQFVRPRYGASNQHLSLEATDGTRVHAVRLEGPADAVASVVLVHGITNSARTPSVYAFAHEVQSWAHVVVVDLRGHGASGGACSFGLHEPLDVAAAAHAARQHAPKLPVVLIGTSLGGSAALLAAADRDLIGGAGVAGVVAISAPVGIRDDGPKAERLVKLCRTRSGRIVLRAGFRTRIGTEWLDYVDVSAGMARLAPAFSLIIHDPHERYFGPEHAEALAAAALEPTELWWMPGAGHGGALLTPAMAARIGDHVRMRLAPDTPGKEGEVPTPTQESSPPWTH